MQTLSICEKGHKYCGTGQSAVEVAKIVTPKRIQPIGNFQFISGNRPDHRKAPVNSWLLSQVPLKRIPLIINIDSK